MHEIMLAENSNEMVRPLEKWLGTTAFSTYSLALDVKNPYELVTGALIHKKGVGYDAYVDKGIFTADPVANYPFEAPTANSWHIENWREKNPQYYDYLITETRLRQVISIPLRNRRGQVSAATFFSQSSCNFSSDTLASAKIISIGVINRAGALGLSTTNDQNIQRLRLLSEKQMKVLKLIAKGKSNLEISIILGLKRRNVDYHVGEILHKLGVSTRVQASIVYSSWWT